MDSLDRVQTASPEELQLTSELNQSKKQVRAQMTRICQMQDDIKQLKKQVAEMRIQLRKAQTIDLT